MNQATLPTSTPTDLRVSRGRLPGFAQRISLAVDERSLRSKGRNFGMRDHVSDLPLKTMRQMDVIGIRPCTEFGLGGLYKSGQA